MVFARSALKLKRQNYDVPADFGLRSEGEEIAFVMNGNTEEGTMVTSAARDITGRKKAEQKFRGLLESAPDAMVFVNGEGKIVLVNSLAVTLFGWKREELLDQKVEMLVPERFHKVHPGHRTGFFTTPKPCATGVDLELYGLRKDGSEFPIEISLNRLETEEGLFFSSAIRDVTERKRVEQALQEKNVELESALLAKDRFLANMSHELRTPLNGIIGFTEFLIGEKPGPLQPKQTEYLNDVLSSARHLLTLINDVLDLAKVEAGKMELHPEQFLIREALEEATAVVKTMADLKQITLIVTVDAGLQTATLDQQKFKQVLFNLLSNAVKFTDQGGNVEVCAKRLDERHFEVQVRDTGIGIRPEDLGRLFTEFEQLDSGTARHFEGTGLGLALTKKIVELQGGHIRVEAEPGKGSLFTATLPSLTGLAN
ncbi:MAG: PAS domain-containing sensor histidine kinase [Verrucomicrobia bacterium]|nr:MAG: PAS domain-containing sensor histidine kinase [Verrucomicrobiota bacterium]